MDSEPRPRETDARVAWLLCVALMGVSCASVEERERISSSESRLPTRRALQLGEIANLGMTVTEIRPEAASGETPQCLLCHANVVLAVMDSPHAKPMIGCVTCHGPSEKHQSVEDNSIKPDRVIPKHDSVTFCGSCHGWKGRSKGTFMSAGLCEMFEPDQRGNVCADCHDAHTTGRTGASDEK